MVERLRNSSSLWTECHKKKGAVFYLNFKWEKIHGCWFLQDIGIFPINSFKVILRNRSVHACNFSLALSKLNPLLCTSTPSYITVPISTCVLCLILQMDTNNSASICPLKFLLAHGLLKQPDQNIFGTPKRSKRILLEEARNIMLFASHLTKTA